MLHVLYDLFRVSAVFCHILFILVHSFPVLFYFGIFFRLRLLVLILNGPAVLSLTIKLKKLLICLPFIDLKYLI